MSVPVLREAPAPPSFAVRSGLWLFARHLFTVMVTVAVVMAVWAVVSAPFVMVFIVDKSFSASGYAGAALWVAGVVGVATLAITPIALVLERLVLRGGRVWTVAGVLLPVVLGVAIAGGVVAMFKLTGSPGAYKAVGITAFLMLLLVIYWPVLWALNLASFVLRRIRHAYQVRRRP